MEKWLKYFAKPKQLLQEWFLAKMFAKLKFMPKWFYKQTEHGLNCSQTEVNGVFVQNSVKKSFLYK